VPVNLSSVDMEKFESKYVNGRQVYEISYVLEVMPAAKEGVLCFKVRCQGNIIGECFMEYARE